MPKKMTMSHAAEQVLRKSGGPLHVREITETMLSRKLWDTKGKTPEASCSAILGVEARFPESTFIKVKDARGVFDLRDLNPQGTKQRP